MKIYFYTLSLFFLIAGIALANEVDHKIHGQLQGQAADQLVFSEKLKILQNTQPYSLDTNIDGGLFIFKAQTYEVNNLKKYFRTK